MRSLILTWDLDGDGTACSSTCDGVFEGAAFCACFNGKVMVNHTGSTQTFIDSVAYDDAEPFHYAGGEYDGEYFSSTLFLEKMLDAAVTFSEDRSAVYLEFDTIVDYDDSHVYDFKLGYRGDLKLTRLSDGSAVDFTYQNASGSSSGSSGGNSGDSSGGSTGGSSAPARQRCSRCGGSGFTNGSVMIYDPAFGGMRSETRTITCPGCGGTGWT